MTARPSYAITYRDEDGKELEALEVYRGCPIFHCPENDDYFWIADTGKVCFWTSLSHARGALGAYQTHGNTRDWMNHKEVA